MMTRVFLSMISLICIAVGHAQEPSSGQYSVLTVSVPDVLDSLGGLASDSVKLDSNTVGYPISKDAIDVRIDYGGEDSMVLDNITRTAHLYGDAYVDYGALKLKAAYIQLDLNSNIATAEGRIDSAGELTGIPVFIDGGQEYEAESMRYNFKTRRGVVYDVSTTQGDLEVLGAVTKFYGGNKEAGIEPRAFGRNALITTCTHDVPHFGIRTSKQKVIANKLAVAGPSNLEIGGVPTPLYLPFGFFPLKQGKSSGLMFPNNYEYSDQWGFGLANVGYYFPINDYLDFTLLTDVYLRGSYRLKGEVRYKKRYKYNGTINIGFSDFRQEAIGGESGAQFVQLASDRSFQLKVNHRQDPKAHPYRTIGGSINIETNQFENLNNNNAANVLNNQLNSNFSLTQKFAGTPFTMSLGLRHAQNTQNRDVNITLPNLDLRMSQINPFKRRNRVGEEKWYENIVLTYNGSARYDISAKDSTLFDPETLDNARFGVQHNFSTDVNLNVLKYFTLSPRVNYTETWYTRFNDRRFDTGLAEVTFDTIYLSPDSTVFEVVADTTSFGESVDERLSEFNAIREYDLSLNMFTQVFGTVRFNKGWLRGLRHTMKPTVGLTYAPDYTRRSLGYFDDFVEVNNDGTRDTVQFSRFSTEIFGGAPAAGRRLALTYGIQNLLEAKTFRRRDSTINKSQFFNNLNIGGSYNFAADSLRWSPINFSCQIPLLQGLTSIQINGSLDPYTKDESGRRINTFEYDATGKLVRLEQIRISASLQRSVGQLRALFVSEEGTSSEETNTLWSFVDDLRVSYQYTIGSQRRADGSLFLKPTINNISVRGQMQMSPKWIFSIGNIGYDFISKATSYPDFTLARDLHCWNMGVSWQPERATYSFYIRVKPSTLGFINVPYNRNRADGFQNQF